MFSHWKAWTDATTNVKARRVADWVVDAFAKISRNASLVDIAPYEKTGGHVLTFTVEFEAPSWPELVVELIATAQCVGAGWHLTGSIRSEVGATTTSTSIPGVKMLHFRLSR